MISPTVDSWPHSKNFHVILLFVFYAFLYTSLHLIRIVNGAYGLLLAIVLGQKHLNHLVRLGV